MKNETSNKVFCKNPYCKKEILTVSTQRKYCFECTNKPNRAKITNEEQLADDTAKLMELCKHLGHGKVMRMAASLWRMELKRKGLDHTQVLVPALPIQIKEGDIEGVEAGNSFYDELVKKSVR